MSVLSRKNKKAKEEVAQETVKELKELSVDQLESINGAGSPFKNIPRVPSSALDSDVRNKIV